MAKSPADRYQTAADMRADLQRAASGLPVAAAPPTRVDMYPGTQRIGPRDGGATSEIPPVPDYDYAGRGTPAATARRRRAPLGAVGLGLVLVLGVVIGVAYYLLAGGKTNSVPLVNGEPVATAQAQITAASCAPRWSTKRSSVAKGLVIGSNPPQGNNVAANTLVTLYAPPERRRSRCPTWWASRRARRRPRSSKRASMSGQVGPDLDPALGQVISQSPSGGTAPPGSTVTITVSGGAVPVPSVIGDSQQTASQILTTAGFAVSVQRGRAGPVRQRHRVLAAPGTGTAAKGSTVTIYVQNGASPTRRRPPRLSVPPRPPAAPRHVL